MKKRFFGLLMIIMVFISVAVTAHAGTDDYPSKYKNAKLDALVDEWNFYNRECTSFVAWRLNSRNGVAFTNQYGGVAKWGDASSWKSVAQGLGITVNNTPAVGAVAWFSYGHVAWVEAVNGSSVTIEEYNYNYSAAYNERTISSSNIGAFIHIKDIGTDTTAPTITKVWYSDVTETSFKVHITATDNVGLSQIGCTAWSAKGGKDDQEWKANTCSGTSATTTLSYSISNHSNTTGTYLVNAAAYDTSWNSSNYEKNYGPYVGKYVDLGSNFNAVIKLTSIGKAVTCESSGKVTSRTYTGANNQIWVFTKTSDGKSYKIKNKATGLCLDVANGSTEVGAGVGSYSSHEGDNQKWYIQGSENAYRLRAKSGWTVLDLYKYDTSEGAVYDMYGSHDGDGQLFTITKLIVATPTITAANVTGGKKVTLACATSGATIYYTTNGSMPTTSSTKYTAPFTVTANTTVKAIAVASGYTNSAAASSTVSVSQAAVPTITASGSKVTLASSISGATIYYTTNGSNPTTSSTKYTTPFNVSSGTTVKAIAVASGYSNSSVASKTITVAQASDYAFTVTQTSSAATVTNTSDKEQKAAVIITEYENGVLKDVSSSNVTFAAGEKKTYNFGGSGTHKIFVWNSLSGMVPLSKQ